MYQLPEYLEINLLKHFPNIPIKELHLATSTNMANLIRSQFLGKGWQDLLKEEVWIGASIEAFSIDDFIQLLPYFLINFLNDVHDSEVSVCCALTSHYEECKQLLTKEQFEVCRETIAYVLENQLEHESITSMLIRNGNMIYHWFYLARYN